MLHIGWPASALRAMCHGLLATRDPCLPAARGFLIPSAGAGTGMLFPPRPLWERGWG